MTRRTLGPPFGRAPPQKLPNSYSEAQENYVRLKARKAVHLALPEDMPNSMTWGDVSWSPREPKAQRSPIADPLTPSSYREFRTFREQAQSPANNKTLTSRSFPIPIAADFDPFSAHSSNPFERINSKNLFFPTEMFIDWGDLQRSYPSKGYSKRRQVNDDCEWKPCLILSHDETSRKYEIQWGDSGTQKVVGREALRFEDEREEDYFMHLAKASELKKRHEGFVRYFSRFEIELSKADYLPTVQYSAIEAAIFRKIALSLSDTASLAVKEELWDLFTRSIHQFVFDSQYFPAKAAVMKCPWKTDLEKQGKWGLLLKAVNSGKVPYPSLLTTLEGKLLSPKNPLHPIRLILHQKITKIRWADYYSVLRNLRSFDSTLSMSELKSRFAAGYSKVLYEIDSLVKLLSEQVFKVMETHSNLQTAAEEFMCEAEVVLESNIQYAVRESTTSLIELIGEYYPLLPIQGQQGRYEVLTKSLKAQTRNFSQSTIETVSQKQSIAILRETVAVLHSDWVGKRLPSYAFHTGPAPLISLSIDSKDSIARIHRGKLRKLYSLATLHWENGQRRYKATKPVPFETVPIADTLKVHKAVRNLMHLTDECLLSEEGPKFFRYKRLLKEQAFGWVSAGKDRLNVDLIPRVAEIERNLQELLKAPLKNIQRIVGFSPSIRTAKQVKVKNAASGLASVHQIAAEVLQFSLYGPLALLAILREFEYLFYPKVNDPFMSIVAAHVSDYVGLAGKIQTIFKHRDLIAADLPDLLQFGLFQVNLKAFKLQAVSNANTLIQALLRELANEHLSLLQDATMAYSGLMERLSSSPQTFEELQTLLSFLDASMDERLMSEIKGEVAKADVIQTSLEEFQVEISEEQRLLGWKNRSWDLQLHREKHRLQRRLQRLLPTFQDAVKEQTTAFIQRLQTVKGTMSEFATFSDLQNADKYATIATDVLAALEQLKVEAEVVRAREGILKLPLSDFQELSAMSEQFVTMYLFWSFASEWSAAYTAWMDKPLSLIDPDAVESKFDKGIKLIDKLKGELGNNGSVMKAAKDLESSLNAFESTIPLIADLRLDCLRDRHWKKIWESLGRNRHEKPEIDRRATQTLRELLNKNILKQAKFVETLAAEAKSEFEVEKIWTKIDKSIKQPDIEIISHPKFPELHLLARLDETKSQLHEFLTTINYLTKSNRHIDPFKEQLTVLEATISAQQALVEDMHEFQELLSELYPVFRIPEMCEQLPRTAAHLADMVSYYHQQLAFIGGSNSVAVKSETRISYPEASGELRKVKEDVRLKVAEKQELCARLFFLSDAEIVGLMQAASRDGKVEVGKLFPGLERIVIDSGTIVAIERADEVLALKKVVPLAPDSHSKTLDEWLNELESSLKALQRGLIAACTLALFPAFTWALPGPAESRYIACIEWVTRRTDCALSSFGSTGNTALAEVLSSLQSVLQASPVSSAFEPHSALQTFEVRRQREELACLLLTHCDLLRELLGTPVEDRDLKWKSTLKLKKGRGDYLVVEAFDYSAEFAYEMHSQDFFQSFVRTPAVERQALHVFLTLQHGQDCLFTGETGADKTESQRFLAVLCGRLLYPLAVTSELPFDRAVKVLMGCAAGGYWGSLESVEVLGDLQLSTLGKYAQIVRNALFPAPCRLVIDGYQVKPKAEFAFFGTLERKRKFLPTLEANFREIAVVKADLASTAVLLLQIYGLPQASKLGNMLSTAVSQLAGPVLALTSGKPLHLHLKASVLTLRRVVAAFVPLYYAHPMLECVYLVNNALRQVYAPGLQWTDLALLDEFLATLFSAPHNDSLSGIEGKAGEREVFLKEMSADSGLKVDLALKRCQQLYTLLGARPWVFIVGAPGSGKSLTIATVAKAAAQLTSSGFQVHRLGPVLSAKDILELVERLHTTPDSFFLPSLDGRFLCTPALPSAPCFLANDWVHADGLSIPYGSDVLFSISRSYPKTRLKLLLETESLSASDPAVVAEAGILWLEKGELTDFELYQVLIRRICVGKLQVWVEVLDELYQALMDPALRFFETSHKNMQIDSKFILEMFCRLLAPLLSLIKKKAELEDSIKSIPLASNLASLVVLAKKHTVESVPVPSKRTETVVERRCSKALHFDLLKHIGNVRKPTTITPLMTVEAVYVLSLVNAVGNYVGEAEVFSSLMMQKMREKGEEFACFLRREYSKLKTGNLLDLTFSVKQLTWLPISDIFSTAPTPSRLLKGPSTTTPQRSLTFFESTACRYLGTNSHREELLVPTLCTIKLTYWVEFCLRNSIDIVLFGPHQAGKSSVVMAVVKQLMDVSFSALIPLTISSRTSCDVVQDLIAVSMENKKKKEFGGVGGAHFYAILDDMNLDPSLGIYDLFRYWKETGGWYRDGFNTISDLTVAFVHSYTEGSSRPMWLRAMRHFFLLYKVPYRNSELTSIFRHYIDAGAGGEEIESDGMMSVADESVASLVRLYGELAKVKTEHLWCQVTISDFGNSLKFLSQFALHEDVDLTVFLSMWTFSIRRYFLDQFGSASSEVRSAVYSSLDALFGKCVESAEEAERILNHGVLVPTHKQLTEDSHLPFSDFDLCSSQSLQGLIQAFRSARSVCTEKYPQRLKHLHSLLFHAEEQLAGYVYFYLCTLYDVNSPLPCVLVRTGQNSGPLCKALLYMAAETLKARVFEFNSEDKEDLFASQLMDNFKVFSPSYFPTEAKFEVKRIMEETMINNRRVVLIITLVDKGQLERPLTRRYMDVVTDIISGVRIRLTGFPMYYRDFIDQFRARERTSPESARLYVDEVMEVMLERMRRNITVFFVLSSDEAAWARSPLHFPDMLELFKHEYRQVFNASRVVNFDTLSPPEALIQSVRDCEALVKEFKQGHGRAMLQMVEEELGSAPEDKHYAHEIVAYCCQTMMETVARERDKRRQGLQEAVAKAADMQESILHVDETREKAEAELAKLNKSLEKAQIKLAKSLQELAEGLSRPYESELKQALSSQKERLDLDFSTAKGVWEAAVDSFSFSAEDLADLDRLLSQPQVPAVLYLFTVLVQHQTEDSLQLDKSEAVARKQVPAILRKWKDAAKRLKSLPFHLLPDLSGALSFLNPSRTAKLPRPVRPAAVLLQAACTFRLAASEFTERSQTVETESASVHEKVQAITSDLTKKEGSVQEKLQAKLVQVGKKMQRLEGQVVYMKERREELMELRTAIGLPKAAWNNTLQDISSEQELDYGNCLLASFLLVKGLRKAYPEREAVLSTVYQVLKASGIPCHEANSLMPALIPDYPNFAYQCAIAELSDSPFFYQSAACLYLIHKLCLPFPLVYDPFEVARNYISRSEASNGLLVGKVSSDPEFERKFRDCVVQGRPVLCEDPSTSLYRTAYSAVTWRNQQFLMKLRGMDTAGLRMKTARGELVVHPGFRLYICTSDSPPTALVAQTTQVSFDAVDLESWKGVLVTPLMKALDEAQHRDHVMEAVRRAQLDIASRALENSLISAVLRCDPQGILESPALGTELGVLFRKLRFTQPSARKSVLSIRAFDRSPSLLPDEGLVATPKDKLNTLLQETFSIKCSLEVCGEGLESYAVPCRQLYAILLSAVGSFFREVGVPKENQWEAFAERTCYIVLVKLCQSLPTRKAELFLLVHMLYRVYLKEESSKNEVLAIVGDLIRAIASNPEQEASIQHLKSRYPALFPANFTPASPAFRSFLERDLYSEAKVPDSVPVLPRVLLYAYLRPDLLSAFAANAAQEFLGGRFADIPRWDYSLGTSESAAVPTVVFYQRTCPLSLLERLADVRNVNLIHVQPLVSSVLTRTGRVEIRGIGRTCEAITTAMNQRSGSSHWLVIENLYLLAGLEAEFMVKFLLTKLTETDAIRVFALFQGNPQDFPQWKQLFEKSRRLVYNESSSVQEHMQRWYAAGDVQFYARVQQSQWTNFWEKCSLEELAKPGTGGFLKVEKEMRRCSARRGSEVAAEVLNAVSLLSTNTQVAYSGALLCSVLALRRQYTEDIPLFLPQADVQMLLSDFLTCLQPQTLPSAVLRPAPLSLLRSLLLPSATPFQVCAFLPLAHSVFSCDQSLHCPGLLKAEYPLLQFSTLDSAVLETLLSRYPVEDPLQVAGLPTLRTTSHSDCLPTFTTLQTHIKFGQLASSMEEKLILSTIKEAVAVRLKALFAELMEFLPEPNEREILRDKLSFNTAMKRRVNWFEAKGAVAKDVDLRNSILDSPPSLQDVFQLLKSVEALHKTEFLRVVRREVSEMRSYLNYERSVVSAQQREELVELSKGQVPGRWQAVSPYSTRSSDLEAWKGRVERWLAAEMRAFEVDLNTIYSPELSLATILRAYLVSTRKTQSPSDSTGFLTLEKCGFAVNSDPAASLDPVAFQVRVSGLFSNNVKFTPQGGALMSQGKAQFSPLLFTPTKVPKRIRNDPAYPAGWKAVLQHDSKTQGRKVLLFCPVSVCELWLLVEGKEEQGEWSKRQVEVSL